MAGTASGTAADSGYVSSGFTAVNTSLGNKAAKTADLKSFSSGTATSGQVPTANGSGAVTWTTPAAGVTLASTDYTTLITN